MLLLVLGVTAAAAPAPTFHPSLAAASAAAATDQSLVLLDFSATWCGPCQAMKKNTFPAKEFTEGAGALRVAEVDIDAHPKVAESFNVTAVPTLVLLTADGKIVMRRTGYLDAPALVAWIQEARARAKNGQWEGTAPGSKLDALAKKAAGGKLASNELQEIVALLGEPDPAERTRAGRLLMAVRESAMPPLIEAVADPYLGVRVSASELLRKLSTNAPGIDPWLSPAELADTLVALRQWWGNTGRITLANEPLRPDASTLSSIRAALATLRAGDAARRTEAMSTLVGHGPMALPAIREASKRHERDNPRLLALLEDVRWAILVPDSVERQSGGVRGVLARWSSVERQDAATRLGRVGAEAIPALAELANDADPLVIEQAVRALSGIGGPEVVPAMAALLKATDSNLRMTAAQALGKTKNSAATAPLAAVVDDANEVVACTALAALEQVNSQETVVYTSAGQQDTLPAVVVGALKKALGDGRWRVRAAAVEVAGKLKATALREDLRKLLEDADGFVVKNTLAALGALNARPEPGQLAALAQRLPSLRGDVVEQLAQSDRTTNVALVQAMYDGGDREAKLVILHALARVEQTDLSKTDGDWNPLTRKAASDPDARWRRLAVELISRRPPREAGELIGPLLADEDREVRALAAEVVLSVLAGERRVATRYGLSRSSYSEGGVAPASGTAQATTNKPSATPQQRAAWHAAMRAKAGANPGAGVAAALFATGEGSNDVALLVTALDSLDPDGQRRFAASPALGVIMPKLSLPAGQPVLESLARSPVLFAQMAAVVERAAPAIADYVLDPARFRQAVERADAEAVTTMLQSMLGGYSVHGGDSRVWSLLNDTPRAMAVATALLESTNAAWRAAGYYALGRKVAVERVALFEQGLQDTNGWVRGAAAQGLARLARERPALEEKLGTLLADQHGFPARVAALALLQPELRQLAGLGWQLDFFRYGDLQTGRSEGNSFQEERALTLATNQPAHLKAARERIAGMTNVEVMLPFVLLLAQHGELDGVDAAVKAFAAAPSASVPARPEQLLIAIALTRDARYVPFLRGLAEATRNTYELQNLLRPVRRMTGAAAEQLRADLDQRLRKPAQP